MVLINSRIKLVVHLLFTSKVTLTTLFYHFCC